MYKSGARSSGPVAIFYSDIEFALDEQVRQKIMAIVNVEENNDDGEPIKYEESELEFVREISVNKDKLRVCYKESIIHWESEVELWSSHNNTLGDIWIDFFT